jgi:nucleotide-binding universal stress UspA family protein
MNVLWPVDAWISQESVIETISAQWQTPGTIVRLLAVVEPIPPPPETLWYDAGGNLERVLELREENASAMLQGIAESLSARGFAVESVVRRGRPRRLVALEAREWPADLVLLTVPERQGLVRRLFSGIAMRLADRAACAVEIVRVGATPESPPTATPSGAVVRWWAHRTGE